MNAERLLMGNYGDPPVKFVRGKGTELFDDSGKRYLDFLCGLAVTSLGHSHPRVAWRSSQHRVVSIMRRHGLRWTYGTADSHHFDAVSRSAKRGGHEHDEHAPVLPPECATEVCD